MSVDITKELKEEIERCVKSPYYFFIHYWRVNGEKAYTHLNEREFNELFRQLEEGDDLKIIRFKSFPQKCIIRPPIYAIVDTHDVHGRHIKREVFGSEGDTCPWCGELWSTDEGYEQRPLPFDHTNTLQP